MTPVMTQKNNPHIPAGLWRRPVHLLAFGLGTGAAPFAPGTFGTLLGIPLYLALQSLSLPIYVALCAVLFIVGVVLCHITARDLNVHDHPGIVFDEIVGYLVTMIGAPHGWPWIVAGFLLFRLFDIWKPWPVRVADRGVGGGFGIMLDDLLAAGYAALAMAVITALVL
jgi:phosphatidylglycerophosphatase A